MSIEMYYDGMDGHLFTIEDYNDDDDNYISNDYFDNVVLMIQDIYPGSDLKVDTKSLFHKIQGILYPDGQVTQEQLDEFIHDIDLHVPSTPPNVFDYLIHHAISNDHTIPFKISEVCSKILYKCSGDGDAHSTTVALFDILSCFSLHAKVVIALAAFAVNITKFQLVAQLYPTTPLAKSLITFLDELPRGVELIEPMMDVTKRIIEFKELPRNDYYAEMQDWVHIPKAAYWTIRGTVAFTSQILNHGASNKKLDWEFSIFLSRKLRDIYDDLDRRLHECRRMIGQMKRSEGILRDRYTQGINAGNILELLFSVNSNLSDGSKKRRGRSIQFLHGKNVLLFISDLNLNNEELGIFIQMYKESRHDSTRLMNQIEVLWVPIVNWVYILSKLQEKRIKKLQELMPWYSVYHPSSIKDEGIMFMKREWHFNNIPLLVQLKTQKKEKLGNPIDLRMFLIWETLNFSFSSLIDEETWMEATWSIQLLTGLITTPLVLDWVSEGKHICLYGGEDVEWIKKFTKIAKDTAQAAEIQIEMLYVGKSDYGWKVQENNAIIHSNNLSHILSGPNQIRFFWQRLQRIWLFKEKHGKRMENDPAMRGIATILSFDSNNQGWAVIGKETLRDDEPSKIFIAKNDTILKSLNEYDKWKDCVVEKGFVDALNKHLSKQETPHQCNRMIFPGIENISGTVFCPECERPMQKRFVYRCYH